MSSLVILLLLIPAAFFVGLAMQVSKLPPRNANLSRLVMLLSGLPMIAFCCYGILASMEGSGGQFLIARIVYACLILIVAVSVAVAWWPKSDSLQR